MGALLAIKGDVIDLFYNYYKIILCLYLKYSGWIRKITSWGDSLAVRIVADSCSDIPESIAKELNIKIIPLSIIFGDDVYLDGKDLTNKEFFNKLETTANLPTTSQVTPGQFIEEFKELISSGDDIICITLSSEMSGTYQAAVTAKDFLKTDKITVIDSRSVTFSEGLIAIKAAEAAKEGKTVAELVDYINEMIVKIETLFIVDSLKHLKRGGRITSAEAFVGSLLNIRPILCVENGKLKPYDKVKGRKKGIKFIIDYIKKNNFDLSNKRVAIYNATDEEYMMQLKAALVENFEIAGFVQAEIGGVVGTHSGPGCVGISFMPMDN